MKKTVTNSCHPETYFLVDTGFKYCKITYDVQKEIFWHILDAADIVVNKTSKNFFPATVALRVSLKT